VNKKVTVPVGDGDIAPPKPGEAVKGAVARTV
jgi:hypothetical protein